MGGVFGALYLVVAPLGYTVSGGHGINSMDGAKLLGLFSNVDGQDRLFPR